jgi:hypothetical protein
MSRLLGKFVQDSTITDLQIRLRNNLALRARNVGDTADVEILKVSNTDIINILGEMSMQSNKITDLAAGTGPNDAVNLSQVEALVAGLTDPKDAARVATTAALPASTYNNGTNGTGATLTANANGAIGSIDGVAVAVADRILVKDQSSGVENGIYVVTQLGDGSNPWILTRSDDASIGGGDVVSQPEGEQVTQGMYVPVAQGTLNGSLGYIMTTVDPISLGTSVLTFVQMGESINAGQGISKTGSTISVDAGDGLGFSGNQLVVLVDDDLVNGSTDIKGGEVVGRKDFEETFTLSAGDISNGYVDLTKVASNESVQLFPRFGIKQKAAVDFTVSYTGGSGSKTRVTFAGDLATIVAVGDVIDINFRSLDYV